MDRELEIALVKKDMEIVTALVNKLDPVIDKLQEGFFTVTKMLALHEQKLTSFDEKNKEQDMDLRRLEEDIKESREEVNDRIDSLVRDVRDSEKRLMHEIRDLKHHISGKKEDKKEKVVVEVTDPERRGKGILYFITNNKIIAWIVVGILTVIGWASTFFHHF